MADELTPPVQTDDVSTVPPTMASAPTGLVLSPSERADWDTRISKAQELQQTWHPWWEQALKNYAPRVSESPSEYELRVRSNRSFTIVERKLADLFYQDPEVTVTASPLMEKMPDGAAMVSAHAAILAAKLGLFGVNAKFTANEALFANELFGAGWTKVFYRAHTKDVQEPVRDAMGAPMVDPLTLAPLMQTVPVVVYDECGWESYSNKQALIPNDFKSTNYDKAPWLAMRFTMSFRDGRRMWPKIPEDFQSSGDGTRTIQQQYFDHGSGSNAQASKNIITGVEIYMKSALFRDDVIHPQHLTKLVLIDGLTDPVEYRDSPDQTIDAQGRLTPDSLIGFPYHPITTRVLTDSAYVMSDVAVALPITQELDKSREQWIVQRQINLLKFWYDTGNLSQEALEKAVAAAQGGMVGLPSDAFANSGPNGPIKPFPQVPVSNDNFAVNAIINHDLDETFAIDATASGTNAQGSQTATEANLRQANVNVRLGKEQSTVADWYIRFVGKLSTLIQRYMSVEEAAQYVGMETAQKWKSWCKAIPAPLAFKMTPDSSLRNDTPLDRLQLQNLFTYLANDPHVNRRYFITKLLEKFHIDPAQGMIPDEAMPKEQPKQPNVSMTVKGEDLNPLMPQAPILLDMLSKMGLPVDKQVMAVSILLGQKAAQEFADQQAAKAQPMSAEPDRTHGGKVAQLEGLDKHQRTGGMDGTGAMSPGMSPAGVN